MSSKKYHYNFYSVPKARIAESMVVEHWWTAGQSYQEAIEEGDIEVLNDG